VRDKGNCDYNPNRGNAHLPNRRSVVTMKLLEISAIDDENEEAIKFGIDRTKRSLSPVQILSVGQRAVCVFRHGSPASTEGIKTKTWEDRESGPAGAHVLAAYRTSFRSSAVFSESLSADTAASGPLAFRVSFRWFIRALVSAGLSCLATSAARAASSAPGPVA